MLHRLPLLIMCLSVFCTAPAHADCVVTDTRPIARKIAESDVAFIGTVHNTNGEKATFTVLHDLKNPQRMQHDYGTERDAKDVCEHRFRMDETWLYAGPKRDDATLQLIGATALRRADDTGLALPESWQSCNTDVECKAFAYGCNMTALRADHVTQAESKIWKGMNDPRTVNCKPTMETFSAALCVERKCGWHVIPYTETTP